MAPEGEVDVVALARTGPVHFVGIGGAGMSALAAQVLRSGGRVTGCDARPGSVTAALERAGALVYEGHDPAHVHGAVGVVTTAAMPADHPELAEARRLAVPVWKRAVALGGLVNQGTVVAVAGTHGKTTTTALVTAILAEAGLEPTGFVGGRVGEWDGGLHPGADRLFVVEADEYDRSFHTFRPTVALVTTIEADHLDIYGSLDAVTAAFREFVEPVPAHGLIVACLDDPGAADLALAAAAAGQPVLRYGTDAAADLVATDIKQLGHASRFRLLDRGESLGEVRLAVPGLHNVRNALGALAAARHVGADLEAARRAFARFRGVDRRFQELGQRAGVTVLDDYAHHPTEIEATLSAARAVYPGRRLVAVFQPHLYTRTRDFADAFGRALARADLVFATEIYPAREAPIPGITGELVTRAAEAASAAEVHFVPDLDELPRAVAARLRAGDVCITLGAGSIDRTGPEILTCLEGAA